ncbi:5-formyltetrahydrofolate cyclo-ligase [Drechmeria coniospora]|uniref:5-formyltetrahydrofolate cyclo-ligase n=1 Tax=Drechmeria coniospora TaxID=98403 RepID=A0A151GQ93_DRECN|nr:5-formyltetrahydrofolate cyclo-ligase [Drechmeria coniospora]KYK59266.1 5-formyltetrahydrofolate cyclo-ligase [Drechmeria coniospora]
MAASSLAAAKQQLRMVVKERLSSVSPDSITAQSRKIFESLKDFPPYKHASRISVYLSMPAGEVQTDAIVRHALGAGKQVYVPYLHTPPPELAKADAPVRVMDMVLLASVEDYEGLKLDRWSIPSIDPATVHERQRILGGPPRHPGSDGDRSALDLMLMPGVAFDLDPAGSVRRLGHGKGFYDFFLNRYLAQVGAAVDNPPLLVYGLALTEQLLSASSAEQVPMGPHDRRLHGLVLGTGEIRESPTHSL